MGTPVKLIRIIIKISLLSFVLSACGGSSNAPSGTADESVGGSIDQGSVAANLLYLKGIEKSGIFGDLGSCYLELNYSADLNQVTVRAVAPHPHNSTPQAIVNLAMGPMIAIYNPAKMFYRFQDSTAGVLVKDMVLNADPQQSPSKYGASLLHGDHYDPLFCESLVAVTDAASVDEVKKIFDGFDAIKAQHP